MPPIWQINDCNMKAYYAQTYGDPIRCKTHKENLKNQFSICMCGKSQPTFNYPDEKAKYCASCKKPGMVDVKSPK